MRVILGSAFAGLATVFFNITTVQADQLSTKDLSYPQNHSFPALVPKRNLYARIDAAYSIHGDPTIDDHGLLEFNKLSYTPAWTLGGGFGYYFTRSLRGDITYDYRFSTDISADANAGVYDSAFFEFGLESHVLLANIYYDFNREGRISPYIGVGIGGVYHQTENSFSTPTPYTSTAVHEGSNWNFAGALLAGAAVKINPKMNLDIGYRFLYLGEAKTGAAGVTYEDPQPGSTLTATTSSVTAEDLYTHAFRVGLRYNID